MDSAYYHTKESVEEYIRLAADVHGGDLIAKFKEYLPANATLLEIGSGPGTDWEILKEDYDVIGSDNSIEFLDHLIKRYPNSPFIELNAITLDTDKHFEGIYSNKVMHHLTDDELKRSISRQYEVLNDQGIVCHSFWKGEGTEIFKGMYVNYHTENTLTEMFAPRFEVLLLEHYAEFEDGDSLLLIGRKKS